VYGTVPRAKSWGAGVRHAFERADAQTGSAEGPHRHKALPLIGIEDESIERPGVTASAHHETARRRSSHRSAVVDRLVSP
jgi:hypothetical protein